jgi:hypothetical protein
VDGVTRTIPEWSDLTGTNGSIIRYRVDHGWAAREAVFGRSA